MMLYEYHFDWAFLIGLFLVCGVLAARGIWMLKRAKKAAGRFFQATSLGFIVLFFCGAFLTVTLSHISIKTQLKSGQYKTVSGNIRYKEGAPASKKFTVDGIYFFEHRLDYRKIKNGQYITVAYIPGTHSNTILFIKG